MASQFSEDLAPHLQNGWMLVVWQSTPADGSPPCYVAALEWGHDMAKTPGPKMGADDPGQAVLSLMRTLGQYFEDHSPLPPKCN